MKAAMEPLRPLRAVAGAKPIGVVVVGAVKGDLHDIGKNFVISMLEGASFEVIDLGSDVWPEKFVEAIQEHHPQIVCLKNSSPCHLSCSETIITGDLSCLNIRSILNNTYGLRRWLVVCPWASAACRRPYASFLGICCRQLEEGRNG
jgi:hypothetical protein